MTCNSE